MNMCSVIMAGGSGSRLWPLSRAAHPKQFLRLHGEDTMLQSTIKRLSDLEIESSITICNEKHRFFVAEQLREIDSLGSIILEPEGRNTAPAIALAAFSALKSGENCLLLVLAADHIISDGTAFTKAINEAIPLAENGELVTFGIAPERPHTGFGYIKRGSEQGLGYKIDRFVEKPSLEMAQVFFDSGEYYWNSGMFMFQAERYLEELKIARPDIYNACKASITNASDDLDFLRVNESDFSSCPSESIDYAVMEETTRAVVVPMSAGWTDVGSWSSLWEVSSKDDNGNVLMGDVMLCDSKDSYIRSEDKLVTAIGVKDLIIVSSKDALLVAHKDNTQEVKVITDKLRAECRTEWELHREVHRPWGKYDSIDNGERYQAKLITVKPGAKLSLQMHHHRAEHWIVVSGTARVTKNDETYLLSENESTYIPLGCVHCLENPGKLDLELIEVQSGAYLGEDDIVRFEDRYGREAQ